MIADPSQSVGTSIAPPVADPKPVTAIVTEYRQNSHADVIVGRILEGFNFDGKDRPNLKLVGLFTDQVPAGDWSRALAKKHGVSIYDRIEDAVTLGQSDNIPVAGVLCIGEHGNYPKNEKGQVQYPRRRFFEQVTATIGKHKERVPIFNDKHLACSWDDAKWMYDRARNLHLPFMAGSSLPVTWRTPPLRLPLGCRISEAVAVAYGDVESYGFHALEMLQCMVERRRDGESGIVRVQCVEGAAVWQTIRRDRGTNKLFEAALDHCPNAKPGLPESNCGNNATAFVLDYCDSLRATVVLLNGHVDQFGFAARLRGINRGPGISGTTASCRFHLQPDRPFGHFTYLVKAIDRLIQDHHAPYPIERTLLTTGVLDAAMTSRFEGHRVVATPHLAIRYDPVEYDFATDPIPS